MTNQDTKYWIIKKLLVVTLIFVLVAILSAAQTQSSSSQLKHQKFSVVEKSIAEMQLAMEQGQITSQEIVQQYLLRIATYEDKLNAVITINPRALEEAAVLDKERAEGKIRGVLHGIPIALKDNIHTTNMPTTGGALVLDGFIPSYEATLTKNLRDAGAIIIAKTNMTELANWVAEAMPTNYNALVGYGFNPYDPRRDPREVTFDGRPVLSTGGSSSGTGTAANFWAANVGTETSGSILSPSNQNMLVGIKPTVGRISRYGVIPITADLDTPGPMAKTVSDAAILFGVLEGMTTDPNDSETSKCPKVPNGDYRKFLNPKALMGARIGIPRAFFYDSVTLPGAKEPRPSILNPEQSKIMAEAISILKEQGAIIVDPVDIPSITSLEPSTNLLLWSVCAGLDNSKGKDVSCSIVLKYGMKRDFNKWLASLGDMAPIKTLTELRQWNVAHQKAGAIKYGQAQLDISDEIQVAPDSARYRADREKDILLCATNGIDSVIKKHQLDALLFPGSSSAIIASRPGYPTIIVPFGFIQNTPNPSLPEGFMAKPSPYGVAFTATACSEPRLIELAYAFEQATKRRIAPPLFP
ncbi:MAG: amidase [Acidobacteria bacterium]|nr:amidase [Acidobacteriota bacterium]